MKRLTTGMRLIPLLLIALLLVCGMSGTALAENQFHFDKTNNAVWEGMEIPLILVREGDCAQEGELTFKSSNTKVATVSEDGVVYGVKKGTATITATLKVGQKTWTAKLSFTVARPVTSIEINGGKEGVYEASDPLVADLLDPAPEYADLPVVLMRLKKTLTISATCYPTDATSRKWEMISGDEDIVRVSGTTLTARGVGETVITVRSTLNPEVSQSFRVLVVQPVTKVKVTGDVKTCYVGETIMLEATVSPENASIKDVVWTSSRPDNATVDEYGVVTGVSKGDSVITAKAADGSGYYGSFTVTVKQQPEEVTLKKDAYTLRAGNYVTLASTVLPSSTNDKSVVWSSSDPSVVKVSSSGKITAVSPGVAIITCASKTHPDVFDQAVVTVYQPVTKVAFTDSNPYVAVGDTIYLNWEVSPENATDSSVTFSTNKENVVRVGQDGSVTGLKRGECYVYATANDGSGKKASIKVTVTQPVEGVSMQAAECSVGVGSKTTNTAVFYPEDATITNMTWYSEDATIATVSGTGAKATVTGRAWGETTIIGVTEDGSYVTSFTVKVGNENQPLNIVQLYVEDEDTIRIQVYNESDLTITRFYYVIETYDAWGNPVVCNDDGRSNDFEGYYGYTLEPGDATKHGRFTFGGEFNRPRSIGKVVMTITAYTTEDGNTYYVPRGDRETKTWSVTVLGQ